MAVDLGKALGVCVVVLYLFTILNYLMKLVNKTYGKRMKELKAGFHAVFVQTLRFIVKQHRLAGVLAFLFLAAHVVVQYSAYGYINQTGLVAAIILFLQVMLGVHGAKSPKKIPGWLVVHRSVAAILPFAIAMHVL